MDDDIKFFVGLDGHGLDAHRGSTVMASLRAGLLNLGIPL